MDRRFSIESSLGFTGMLGGALFPPMILLFTVSLGPASNQSLATTTNLLVLVVVLLLLPGAVGLYLTQAAAFGRPATLAAALLVGGFTLPILTAGLEALVGSPPYGAALSLLTVGLLLVGTVGTGLATVYHGVLPHAKVGGGLLTVSMLAALGVGPALGALGVTSEVAVAFLGTGPLGLAWLVLGYDVMTRRELTIEPTRIRTGG